MAEISGPEKWRDVDRMVVRVRMPALVLELSDPVGRGVEMLSRNMGNFLKFETASTSSLSIFHYMAH